MKRRPESKAARRATYKPGKVNLRNLPRLTSRGGKRL